MRAVRSIVLSARPILAVAMLVAALFAFVPAADAGGSPPFIPPTADWLTTVNYYRAMSGLGPVSEDPNLSSGAYLHSCYMLYNGISHDETPGLQGYTTAGRSAGNNGNVAVSSVYNQSVRSHIELWMTGPYHAIGVLRPNLHTVGFGKCDKTDTPTWHSGATLDVLHGLGSDPAPTQPILFPGDGTTTNLDRFVVESPNPLDPCGWSGSAGLPVIAMMPEQTAGASATITGPSGPLQTCTVSTANTSGTAQAILAGNNAVVAIPRSPLVPGDYQVSVHTNARTVNWSFTVDPQAATGGSSSPAASAVAGTSGFQPLTPARIVDTRINRGSSKLFAGGTTRIQVTGTGGVPAGATAVVANITATESNAPGFVSLWNCNGGPPTASTLNYVAGQNVPNSATVPLDSGGGLCVYSYSDTQLVIDTTGYYSADASTRYTPLNPTRVMDTRFGIGPAGRLVAGQIVELQVTGIAGVPTSATAVALNVTTDNPSADGYVTVYPCGDRPDTSSLNPATGSARANLAISAVSATGTICLFTLQPTELVVDVSGYFAPTGSTFTASTPFRFTDTRDKYRVDMNAGTGGNRLLAGQVTQIQMAGVRGIPGGAKAISANITVVDATGAGWVAAWPCGPQPSVSNVNYGPSDPVANAAELALSPGGAVCVVSYTDAQVVIDVNGWWS